MADARAAGASLRTQLLVALLACVALVWAGTATIGYVESRHELDELLDAHLAQSAAMLIVQVGDDVEEIDTEHAPAVHRYARRVAFQLWEDGTRLRLHSTDAPNARLSPHTEGFSDSVVDGAHWRVFSAWDARHRFLVQVGEHSDARGEIAQAIARNLLLPLGIALPLLAVIVAVIVNRATRPLRALNAQVVRRAPDNLGPLAVDAPPREVAPLVASLNDLFARVRASIERERQFTSDAAHELRTPLAALRAQAQVARGAASDAERAHALDGVIEGCDRAAHLVDQLLTLARLEPDAVEVRHDACDLRAIARDVVAALAPGALARDIDVELDADEAAPAVVRGEAALIAVLLRNLVDNAIRYSPPQARVRVTVARRDGAATVAVADSGPGLSAAEREKLGRRFQRFGRTAVEGTGLGLSIARRIADLHEATLAFDAAPEGSGLIATVTFARVAG